MEQVHIINNSNSVYHKHMKKRATFNRDLSRITRVYQYMSIYVHFSFHSSKVHYNHTKCIKLKNSVKYNDNLLIVLTNRNLSLHTLSYKMYKKYLDINCTKTAESYIEILDTNTPVSYVHLDLN